MKKNLKKTREFMFKRCSELLSSSVSYLNQMQNAIDLNYNDDEDHKRFDLYRRISDAYNWLNFSYLHENDMSQDFVICSSIFSDVYKLFYNFKF